MRLRRLTLSGFRNLRDMTLEVPAEGVAILGGNAQGKSNLLEAIYYLEVFRSFRGAPDRQLVRFGEEVFRVGGELEPALESGAPDSHARKEVTAAFQSSGRIKKVAVDGESPTRLGDAIGTVGAVLFTPDDLRLVSDGPQLRRRFLDILLSLNEPGYLEALQRFRQGLSQRNAALRERRGAAEVRAWDETVLRAGSRVTWSRATWIRDWSEGFGRYYREISGSVSARISYDPGLPTRSEWSGLDRVIEDYRRGLSEARGREARLGTTVVGPHRDELRLVVEASDGDRDLREYGSGGQRRTAALGLRLVEADTVRARRGREPILLMDDIFAELDEGRGRRVLELLDRSVPGQVILTAPKENDVRLRREVLARWLVRGGEVTT